MDTTSFGSIGGSFSSIKLTGGPQDGAEIATPENYDSRFGRWAFAVQSLSGRSLYEIRACNRGKAFYVPGSFKRIESPSATDGGAG